MRSPATSSLGARVSGEGESAAERSDGSSLGDSSPIKECAMEDVEGERVALSTVSPRSKLFSAE